MALLTTNGYLWLGKDDQINHVIHLEMGVPKENRASLTSCVFEGM